MPEFEIDYIDSEGLETTRKIGVRQFELKEDRSDVYLRAHCHLRNANRGFHASRIKRCVDMATGHHVEHLPEYISTLYRNTLQGKIEGMREMHGDEMSILVYIAKADGSMSRKERDVIAEYISLRMRDTVLTPEVISRKLIAETPPTITNFKRAVGRLNSLSEDQRREILDAAKRILYVDKNITALEQESIQYMERRLGS